MRKINLHLLLDDFTRKYCQSVNAGIRSIADSVIIFNDESKMIPHVSLVMGELKEDELFKDVNKIIREELINLDPLIIKVKPPYLENVRNRYVFSDVDGDASLLNLKSRLMILLNSKYLSIQTDYTQTPHITLGHVEEKQEQVRTYLQSLKADFKFTCYAAEISDVGPKGTCVNSLEVIPFSGPKPK